MSDRWEEVEDVFNRALELDAPARAAFLDDVCAGDSGLRQEVVSLLRYEKAARRFIETPAIDELADELGRVDDPLPAGHRIGPYTVISLLGEGGMGEVYRARDTKLGRDVAIKALSASFALDLNRIRRLDREARLLATLNHPNIAAIYGVEEALGMQFLILELVEGETLREVVDRGPMPPDDALRVALQIAEALEAAHSSNVIHRDLKPSNIRVTPDGRVKVLDFGLAKAMADDEDLPVGLSVRDLSDEKTQVGTVLGTAAYMSPEQACGRPVDTRTDLWSFGCVLYELLTGRPAWGRRAGAGAEPVRDGPDFSRLPAGLRSGVVRLIRRCLEADPARRPADAGKVVDQLHAAVGNPKVSTRAGRRSPTNGGRATLGFGYAAAGVLAAAGLLWALRGKAAVPNVPADVCPECGARITRDRCAGSDH